MIQVNQNIEPNPKPLPFRFNGDDSAMAAGIKAGHPGAMEALFLRYGEMVERIVMRVMGIDHEIADLVQDVFVAAYSRIHQLRDDAAVKSWLTSLTIFTVRQRIRKRSRRRVYWVHDTKITEESMTEDVSVEDITLLKTVYHTLDAMPAEERIVFALRFLEGMEITEAASAMGISESTVKRRQRKAEKRFAVLARRHPALLERMGQSEKWRDK